MINKINRSSVNSVNRQPQSNQPRQQQFTGGENIILAGIQYLEQQPMMNVAVADLATAIVPRTVVEGQTNPYAGFEAFRREASGLVINCMIPGVIVLGIASALQPMMMGKNSKMAKNWANEDTIKMVNHYWKEAQGANNREKIENTIRKIITNTEGIDGNKTVNFSKINSEKLDSAVKNLADAAEKMMTETPEKGFFSKLKANRANKKEINKLIKGAFETISGETLATENIRINGFKGKDGKAFFDQSLKSVFENTPKLLREFTNGNSDEISKNAVKLLNTKGILGLGVIIPLAIAAQPINRWLTEKSSGKKGAPIYKDFADAQVQELSKDEKAALFRQKIISISSMVGVSLLSMMKLPNMAMLKGLAQFKGVFPSMDQARLVSTATFASRMGASQDKNDLREATVRDIATFCSFYFLGDYVAKGIATAVQKAKGVTLINELKDKKANANVLEKFWHWAKHTALKSSDELATKKLRDLRAACQLGNLAFSLIALGLVIPKIYRGKTDAEREKQLKEMGISQSVIDKYYRHLEKNDPHFASRANTYNQIFTSK